jgi:Family of unknown function (DUF5675)
MLLEVRRDPSAQGCTLGSLYVDGEFECFTLEDTVREVPEQAVEKWKVAGETAIPAGAYKVVVTLSARFGKALPLLMDVPGFQGVRIHSGNVAADTEGSILVGNRRMESAVLGSRVAFQALFAKIQAAVMRDEPVQIRITNPPLTTQAGQVSVV